MAATKTRVVVPMQERSQSIIVADHLIDRDIDRLLDVQPWPINGLWTDVSVRNFTLLTALSPWAGVTLISCDNEKLAELVCHDRIRAQKLGNFKCDRKGRSHQQWQRIQEMMKRRMVLVVHATCTHGMDYIIQHTAAGSNHAVNAATSIYFLHPPTGQYRNALGKRLEGYTANMRDPEQQKLKNWLLEVDDEEKLARMHANKETLQLERELVQKYAECRVEMISTELAW